MATDEKPRTPGEILHQRASDLARDALELQALTALNTAHELMREIANWCDGHPAGHGAFFEVQYGVSAEKGWEVNLFLGVYRHHRARDGVLHTSGRELEPALVAMLKLLPDVAPAAD